MAASENISGWLVRKFTVWCLKRRKLCRCKHHDEGDPLIIEDLAALRKATDEKPLDKAVPSEVLNVLIGSRPIGIKRTVSGSRWEF